MPEQLATSGMEYLGPRNRTLALFLVSVLALFLELLLIRWIGTEINIFAYLQNTVLVVCFLGLGMGCLTSRQPIVLRNLLIPLFIILLLLSIPTTRNFLGNISLLLSTLGDLVAWKVAIVDSVSKAVLSVSAGLIATYILMLFIWEIFVPLGRILGRLMNDHPKTIQAYSVNIAGSLVGIWAFVVLSVFYQPPAVWFVAVAVLLLFIVTPTPPRGIDLALLAGIVVLSWFADRDVNSKEVIWSPYQKLALFETGSRNIPFIIDVNNTGFQPVIDLGAKNSGLDLLVSPDIDQIGPYYFPLLAHPNPKTVLVVGAGTGNDVAAALKHQSVQRIAAVEIDPAIISWGHKHHPNSPYDSTKVMVFNDDARSFFSTSKEHYDLIIFGFLDSHTMTAMTNARLDHYVYTRESLERVKSLLADGGIVVIKFLVQRSYIADRIARLLRDVFNEEPLSLRLSGSTDGPADMLFVAGDLNTVHRQIATDDRLSSLFAKWKDNGPLQLSYQARITTDDWPYLYLRNPHIPLLYYFLALMIFALFLYTKWRFKFGALISNWKISHWHFFFLGAAFLLLEVQNISKASVVLGSTWWVNAVIISGILIMILLANFISAKLPKFPLWLVYIGLIGSCITLYFVDLAQFAFLPYAEKATIVGILAALPVLFSGIVFIRSFAEATGKDVALGANFIGSLVGGLLQSVTFITGIKTLLLIVATLYFAAMLCSPRLRGAVAPK